MAQPDKEEYGRFAQASNRAWLQIQGELDRQKSDNPSSYRASYGNGHDLNVHFFRDGANYHYKNFGSEGMIEHQKVDAVIPSMKSRRTSQSIALFERFYPALIREAEKEGITLPPLQRELFQNNGRNF